MCGALPKMNNPQNIRSLSVNDLRAWCETKKEKSFRANQVFEWLWKKGVASIDEMSNLPVLLRNNLKEDFEIHSIRIASKQKSSDGTVKFGFLLYDNNLIEGVLIPDENRYTACISSQAGCSLDCRFCATGKLGRKRNLETDEIYLQAFLINEYCLSIFNSRLDNIVLMGMGEPLLNYKNVMEAINMMTAESGMGFSPRRITLSTAGISKMIRQLADDGVRFNLAVSLHSVIDEKRSAIMSINDTNNLQSLKEAIQYFHSKTGTRIFYEYLLLKDFNDSHEDARAFAEFCKISPCKINLIEYNPIEKSRYHKSEKRRVKRFIHFLKKCNLIVHYRQSRGGDIDAACGQLAGKTMEIQ
ncbi:MAG: 23S rRNA (adenine(2503)-C(2))-methyltransferase RlmN [Bacteroidetes bacterium]|nr:23S rRNA (adenine(2503)-C(2))-methyltransferase RlmN [Bacteroidota bacterium]